ncbi:MAG: hypothetical protein IKE53_04670 [Clostridiales bacterium]|nr:hypothetical protein [Clostridiales bacterium]
MRKTLCILLSVLMLFLMSTGLYGCGKDTDYPSVQAMYQAHKNGEDIIGKTVELMASHDYYMGQIFYGPMPEYGPNVSIDVTGDGVENIKEEDQLVIKVTKINSDGQFAFSISAELVD